MQEQIIYFVNTLLVVDILILGVSICTSLFKRKGGYHARKILWFILAVRLVIPVQSVSAKFPADRLFYQIDLQQIQTLDQAIVHLKSGGNYVTTKGKKAGEDQNTVEVAAPEAKERKHYAAKSQTEGNNDENTEVLPAVKSAEESGNLNQRSDLQKQELQTVQKSERQIQKQKAWVWQKNGLVLIWFIGCLLLILFRGIQYYSLKKIVRKDVVCKNKLYKKCLTENCEKMRIRKKPVLLTGKNQESPMIFGMLHPAIVLPKTEYSEKEVNLIIRHELCHYQKRDLWYKFFLMAVCDLYWFNPVLLLMKKQAYQDLECVCDEVVLKNLPIEDKKLYAEMILRGMSRKKQLNDRAAAFLFEEKEAAKDRIRAMFQNKKRRGYIGLILCVFLLAVSTCVWQIQKNEVKAQKNNNIEEVQKEEAEKIYTVGIEDQKNIPVILTRSLEVLTSEKFAAEWMKEEQELFKDNYQNDMFSIPGKAVRADMSSNGEFCIYLTEDGSLYAEGDVAGRSIPEENLLMKDVESAQAGENSIIALKKDGSVWWWGEYKGSAHTNITTDFERLYAKTEGDRFNPVKMMYTEPHKMLEDCVYVTTGANVGAALTKNGELYTWGLNIFGQCGTKVSKDDFQREPVKVSENVEKVWIDQIGIENGEITEERIHNDVVYNDTLFIQKKDGTVYVCGKGFGDSVKRYNVYDRWSIHDAETCNYTDSFLPVIVKEYSSEENKTTLKQLKWNQSENEVKKYLENAMISYSYDREWNLAMEVDDGRYDFYFDDSGRLKSIATYEMSSRDGTFSIGMSEQEIEQITGETLEKTSGDFGVVYWCPHSIDNNYYGFSIFDGKVTGIYESEEML